MMVITEKENISLILGGNNYVWFSIFGVILDGH